MRKLVHHWAHVFVVFVERILCFLGCDFRPVFTGTHLCLIVVTNLICKLLVELYFFTVFPFPLKSAKHCDLLWFPLWTDYPVCPSECPPAASQTLNSDCYI